MIKDELRKIVLETTKKAFPKLKIGLEYVEVERPPRPEFGDWMTNIALKLSKKIGSDSQNIAEKIHDSIITTNGWGSIIDETGLNIAGPGFLNFKISKQYYQKELKKILKEGDKFGNLNLYKGKKIQVEFISANPTGPLTLANGRGGFGGDVLARVFEKASAEVTREYYVNDGGNQVKILGDSILYLREIGKPDEKKDLYQGEYIEKWEAEHQKEVKKYKNPEKIGRIAARDILENLIKPSVSKMKIKFDNWFSEQSLYDKNKVKKAINFLKSKKLIYEKDEALWFKSTKFGDDKDRVIKKSDGSYTYIASDIAYHWDKFKKRKFDKVINFLGADHFGYVNRLQAAVSAMGTGGDLDILIFQLVRLVKGGKEYKMSKRKGTYVTMDDLLELIEGSVEEASDVARFFFLQREFNTHMDFNLDLAREHSEKNPVFYVKYAHARLSGILRRAKEKVKSKKEKVNLSLLTQPEEINLIKELIRLPEILEEILPDKNYPVHRLTFYAQDIAAKFHSFYEHCKVIDEEKLELTVARLKLVEATKIVLGIVMRDLLGIETPERM